MKAFRITGYAARELGSGALLGWSIVPAALAAVGDDVATLQAVVLGTSLALLGVGLALKARSLLRQRGERSLERGPDLRWWKNHRAATG